MPEATCYPRVNTIILNWNGLRDTLECLESLSRSVYPNHEVIVVDNGSSDGSAETIRKRYPEVHVIQQKKNLGFSGGNNVGIREAINRGAEFVWLLNNDTTVEPDTLGHLVDTGTESDDIGLVSPVIFYYERRDEIQFCGSYLDWQGRKIVKTDLRNQDRQQNGSTVLWGTALFIKRSVVERMGYLDEKYFAYHEDEEYSIRAARYGFRALVDSGAKIFHKNSRSTGGNDTPFQVFLRSRNMYFLWKDLLEGRERSWPFRIALAKSLSYAAELREKGLEESCEACLEGLWNGICGRGGGPENRVRIPRAVRAVARAFLNWHPYLWVSLLEGDHRTISARIRGK